ncbi:TolC family protein [Acidobacteriota bacterium]
MIKTPFLVKILWTLSIVAMLTGCSVHTQHTGADVSNTIKDRTGHDLLLNNENKGPILPDDVSLSDGLTEDEAVAIALWNNALFQTELVQLGFAKADLIEAGLLRNPIFSLLFPLGPKQLEATLNFPLEFFWQRPNRVAVAKLNAEMIADNLVQYGLNLVRDVRMAYTQLILAREHEKIVKEISVLQHEIADIASTRLEVGDISGLEETAFLLEAARKQESSINSVRDSKLSENRLISLLGLGLQDTPFKISGIPLLSEKNYELSELYEVAFSARPDLRGAEIRIEKAGRNIGWERSKILNLTASLDANAEGKEGFEIGPGMQLELPLFSWNKGKIARAQAELEQASKHYLALKQQVTNEVLEAYTSLLAARQSLEIWKKEVFTLAENTKNNAKNAFNVGEISYLELLAFKQQFLETCLHKANTEAAVRQAEINLKYSLGFKLK